MLKVAVVTHYFPSSATPWQGHSAYETLKELAKLCDVHVFCSTPTYPEIVRTKLDKKTIDPAWRPGGRQRHLHHLSRHPALRPPLQRRHHRASRSAAHSGLRAGHHPQLRRLSAGLRRREIGP